MKSDDLESKCQKTPRITGKSYTHWEKYGELYVVCGMLIFGSVLMVDMGYDILFGKYSVHAPESNLLY